MLLIIEAIADLNQLYKKKELEETASAMMQSGLSILQSPGIVSIVNMYYLTSNIPY